MKFLKNFTWAWISVASASSKFSDSSPARIRIVKAQDKPTRTQFCWWIHYSHRNTLLFSCTRCCSGRKTIFRSRSRYRSHWSKVFQWDSPSTRPLFSGNTRFHPKAKARIYEWRDNANHPLARKLPILRWHRVKDFQTNIGFVLRAPLLLWKHERVTIEKIGELEFRKLSVQILEICGSLWIFPS